jgi:HemY protein
MRAVVWLVVLFAAATALALFMGGNDAVVTLFWSPWRIDVSLNVFILGLIVLGVALYVLLRGLDALLSLPERARLWRAQRRDLQANTLLQEAVFEVLAGRYSRAQKAASAAVAALRSGDTPSAQRLLEPLAWLVKAESAHRLQDRTGRNEAAAEARTAAQRQRQRAFDEAVDLRAAAWSLDDRRAEDTLQRLDALPPGVARRTAALRLRLKAARLAGEPAQALHTARLLNKHHGFGAGPQPVAGAAAKAIGISGGAALLRRLAQDHLGQARDVPQLVRLWQSLEPAERRDPHVAAHAAHQWVALGDPAAARECLLGVWPQVFGQGGAAAQRLVPTDEEGLDAVQARQAFLRALVEARAGLEPHWLARLEAAVQVHPREAAPAWAAGMAFHAAGLWGKARHMLHQALRPVPSAAGGALTETEAALAWLAMGDMAQRDGDSTATLTAYRQAAVLAVGLGTVDPHPRAGVN